MARLGREDWLALGRAAIEEEGPSGLTVEALTRRAGKTRGSFYHHFESQGAFLRALAAAWAAEGGEGLATERGLRAIPEAAEALAAADAARLARFRATLPAPGPEGEAYAEIAQALRLGALLMPATTEARLAELQALLAAMVEAHWHE
ncbi:MAG: helix-turn-helix domain-containing protein [Pikeienuella sp.]|uniref:helix-turn-helix domain-containing protein n=1 Tax=Pikeienuella sp. TaxID=2831957 RepID=UPI00391A83A8